MNRTIGGFCTGTLVGVHVVITAAHCLFNTRTRRWLRPQSLHFLAGYQRGSYIAHARAAKVIIAPGYRHNNPSKLEKAATDWALIVLEKPLGAQVGYVGLQHFPTPQQANRVADRPVSQAGYSQDRAHVLTVHNFCRLRRLPGRVGLLGHDCDTVHGDSGSPILTARKDKYFIQAIHVATMGSGRQALGLAVPSANFFKAAADLLKPGQAGAAAAVTEINGQAPR